MITSILSPLYKRLKKQRKPLAPSDTLNTIFIHADHIKHNLATLQRLHPHDAFFPVVKSNAYGHGCRETVSILAQTNCEMIAVDSYPEYQIVRDYSSKPILIMGELTRAQIRACDLQRACFAVNSLSSLQQFANQRKRVSIHLFVNTGMNREGLAINQLDEAIQIIKTHRHLVVEGLMSHLSDADDPRPEVMQAQQGAFRQAFEILSRQGIVPMYRHLGASAGTLVMDEPLCNAWRPGLALYGYNPLPADHPLIARGATLKPALSIQSTITCIQELTPGQGVSYTKSWRASAPSRVGMVAFGYAEGLMRSLSNKIHLGTYQQVGNICMNYSTVLLDGTPTKKNKADTGHLLIVDALTHPDTLQQRAQQAGTIVYELLVKLAPGLKRKVV